MASAVLNSVFNSFLKHWAISSSRFFFFPSQPHRKYTSETFHVWENLFCCPPKNDSAGWQLEFSVTHLLSSGVWFWRPKASLIFSLCNKLLLLSFTFGRYFSLFLWCKIFTRMFLIVGQFFFSVAQSFCRNLQK